jgi:hypothetical protein
VGKVVCVHNRLRTRARASLNVGVTLVYQAVCGSDTVVLVIGA